MVDTVLTYHKTYTSAYIKLLDIHQQLYSYGNCGVYAYLDNYCDDYKYCEIIDENYKNLNKKRCFKRILCNSCELHKYNMSFVCDDYICTLGKSTEECSDLFIDDIRL